MANPTNPLAALHNLLTRGLRSTKDLLEAAQLCRSLISPSVDGAGAFFLFALYFENLERLREGQAVEVEKYEPGISQIIQVVEQCLNSIENYDPVELHANLDSFARTAERLRLP